MFPSGSRNAAKWQTPESHVSAMNSTPLASSSARASATSVTRTAKPAWFATNGRSSRPGSPEAERDVRSLQLPFGHLTLGQSKHLAIPRNRADHVPRRDRDDIHLLDAHRLPKLPLVLPKLREHLGTPAQAAIRLSRRRKAQTALAAKDTDDASHTHLAFKEYSRTLAQPIALRVGKDLRRVRSEHCGDVSIRPMDLVDQLRDSRRHY